MDAYYCTNNGVQLQSFEFQNHDCEQGIQEIHPDYQYHQEEHAGAIAVYISAFQLVGSSSNPFSPAEERISA